MLNGNPHSTSPYNPILSIRQIRSMKLRNSAAARARVTRAVTKLPPGPCKSGTGVVVKGTVLQEIPDGLLVMKLQWRGKEFCGCFIAADKQEWALPRFDDPSVNSLAFLTRKAELLASDVEESTDNEYSPKAKRKKPNKAKKGKKKTSGRTRCETRNTRSNPGKPAKPAPVSNRRKTGDTPPPEQPTVPAPAPPAVVAAPPVSSAPTPPTSLPILPPTTLPTPPAMDQMVQIKKTVTPPLATEQQQRKLELKNSPLKNSPLKNSPLATVTKTIAEPSSNGFPTPVSIPSFPATPTTSSDSKLIRTERTATIPIGPIPLSSPLSSPFHSATSLISPLSTNNGLPSLLVPPPFFIPNFLQSAKFLAEGVGVKNGGSGGDKGSNGFCGLKNSNSNKNI
eukprot:sb/3465452/